MEETTLMADKPVVENFMAETILVDVQTKDLVETTILMAEKPMGDHFVGETISTDPLNELLQRSHQRISHKTYGPT